MLRSVSTCISDLQTRARSTEERRSIFIICYVKYGYTMQLVFYILLIVNAARSFTPTGNYPASTKRFLRIPGVLTTAAKNSDFEHLEGKSLISIDCCLDAYTIMKNREKEEFPDTPKVVFVDASWWHKGDLNGREMFMKGPRIPGSKHFDLDDIALTPDQNPHGLPHMLPNPNLFSAVMDEYGINNGDHIIITAREGVYFTPRIWFLFKTFGHDSAKIHLMQGSLEQWIELGGEVETGVVDIPTFQEIEHCDEIIFRYKSNPPTNVCGMTEVLHGIQNNHDVQGTDSVLILDSRGSSFSKGHMPGAIHLPYNNWVSPENTLVWKDVDDLKKIFSDAGVDPLTHQKIICSCGSGVSVCNTLLALELCGRVLKDDQTKMYDASWSEWGMFYGKKTTL